MGKENFVVITFSDEKSAIDASHKLQDLALRGDIAIRYAVMLRKGENGEIEALKKSGNGADNTWSGMMIGMLVGMFMGPLGFLISTLAGTAIGAGVDYSDLNGDEEFSKKVEGKLTAGKIAIVANCDESSGIFVDNAMKELGGEVFRTTVGK